MYFCVNVVCIMCTVSVHFTYVTYIEVYPTVTLFCPTSCINIRRFCHVSGTIVRSKH
jgi:hypothetical protein